MTILNTIKGTTEWISDANSSNTSTEDIEEKLADTYLVYDIHLDKLIISSEV